MSPARKSKRPGPKAKPPAVIGSEGQRLLLAVDESLAKIAAAIQCNKTSVLDWRNGDKTPTPEMRARLFGAYKIPTTSWDAVPISAAPPSEPPPHANGIPTTLEDCLALLKMLRDARKKPGQIRPADAVRLASAETRLLALRHRLEHEGELLEDRIVREHPRWRALKAGILKALSSHPAAAKAVAEVIAAQDM